MGPNLEMFGLQYSFQLVFACLSIVVSVTDRIHAEQQDLLITRPTSTLTQL